METINELKKFCPRCNSDQIVKSGKHRCPRGVIQRYKCKMCGTSFSNHGYYKGRHAISLVQYAAVLYRERYSYEKIQSRLKAEFGLYVSRSTVGNWMEKLKVQPRQKSSGNQKDKLVRELIEIGNITTVRCVDSFHPERFIVLDNYVANLFSSSVNAKMPRGKTVQLTAYNGKEI